MPILTEIVVHEETTDRSEYRYQFTPKHHGADRGAAQWLPELSLAAEFAVFNSADEHDLSDSGGNLYGVQSAGENLRSLGKWDEQVAEFPVARAGEPWHGYPVYPLVGAGPVNRRGQKGKPERAVFDKMLAARIISPGQRKLLLKGDHA